MVGPVVKVVEDGQTNVWMGYNDVEMDVVYAGHVAEAEILAVKGLLRGITDPDAPKIDGEAFNITDDSPCPPWTFFRKYWVLAGDKTPMSSVWMFPPGLVLFMAHFAEWWTWIFSLGKNRPEQLKLERLEFALFTRTYSIDKARERLGFKPWVNQPYGNQDDAVKGALEWVSSLQAPFLLTNNADIQNSTCVQRTMVLLKSQEFRPGQSPHSA